MTSSRKAILVLGLGVLAATLGATAATQSLALQLNFARALGPGWLAVGGARLYAPWSFLGWYGRYAGSYPRQFDQALPRSGSGCSCGRCWW
jgi:type IV secretion system protein VirD4